MTVQSIWVLTKQTALWEQSPSRNSEISRLFVLPEQQRKGYGEALLAYAEKLVFAEYPAVTLDASLPAKAMYLKQGYQTAEFHCLPAEKMAFLCYDVMVKQR